jgi:hypothetical protein
MRGHAYYFPLQVRNGERLDRRDQQTLFSLLGDEPGDAPLANLSPRVRHYLAQLKIRNLDGSVETASLIWMHALAVGYSPAYLAENADGIRRDWPRIPLPDTRKALDSSAALGRQVAALLDTEAEVPGVTAENVEQLFPSIGGFTKVGGGDLDPNTDDFAVTAGWGHAGKGGVTMPAKGRIVQRAYQEAEREAIAEAAQTRGLSVKRVLSLLGPTTCDVYLNEKAYWKNVPVNVWEYYIGGYQVIKKWLSYREHELLGRPLRVEEAREVMNMVRRLAGIILLQPALDDNYRRVKAHTYPWPGTEEVRPGQ